MEVKIVLGHTFGDEGKGVTVQWLCKKALDEGKKPLVVRFSGGPQAAHTVFNGGVEHICSSVGSGVLLGVPTLYTNNFYLDPICFANELEVLRKKNIEPIYRIDRDIPVITPYDVAYGIDDVKVREDGTCGKGLYPAFKRCREHESYLSWEVLANPTDILKRAKAYYKDIDISPDILSRFTESCGMIHPMPFIFNDFDVVIYEGSQGLLLDMDCGFYPHVTPSKVGLNGVPSNMLENAEVYLVTRTYTTRHGNGYEPRYSHGYDLSSKHETNVCNEFQGEFKTGALEIPLLNQAYQRHCIDNYVTKYGLKINLVITHMDVPMENGYFVMLNKGGGISRLGTPSPTLVVSFIISGLDYRCDRIFYNDSVESNIRQI